MKCKSLIVLTLGLFLCSCSQKRELEGRWTAVSAEKDTQMQKGPSKDQLAGAELTLKGETYALTFGDKKSEGSYRLDPKKQPKEIEFTGKNSISLAGIYKLEGQELTLCLVPVGPASLTRPQTFDVPAGSSRFLVVLKRQ